MIRKSNRYQMRTTLFLMIMRAHSLVLDSSISNISRHGEIGFMATAFPVMVCRPENPNDIFNNNRNQYRKLGELPVLPNPLKQAENKQSAECDEQNRRIPIVGKPEPPKIVVQPQPQPPSQPATQPPSQPPVAVQQRPPPPAPAPSPQILPPPQYSTVPSPSPQPVPSPPPLSPVPQIICDPARTQQQSFDASNSVLLEIKHENPEFAEELCNVLNDTKLKDMNKLFDFSVQTITYNLTSSQIIKRLETLFKLHETLKGILSRALSNTQTLAHRMKSYAKESASSISDLGKFAKRISAKIKISRDPKRQAQYTSELSKTQDEIARNAKNLKTYLRYVCEIECGLVDLLYPAALDAECKE